MTEEDKTDFELLLEAHRNYSVQKTTIQEVERQPAEAGWAWEPAHANTIEPPSDFRFGPSEVQQPAGQPRSNRSPGK